MTTEDVLTRFTPFNLLTTPYRLEALKSLEYLRLETGAFLFKRGKPLAEAFYLLEGAIDLIDHNFDSRKLISGTEEAAASLNPESVSTFSARATSDVLVFTVNREQLDNWLKWSQVPESAPLATQPLDSLGSPEVEQEEEEEDEDIWFDHLLNSHLFAGIPMAHVQQLFTKLQTIPVKAGQKIMREGERGDYFYVLGKGSALITNALGTVNVELKPGMSFGEEALLGRTPRNASVTMTRDGIIKRMTEEDFNQLIRVRVIQYLDHEGVEALTEPFACIDVKLPIEYRAGHYPGAINIPLARLRGGIKQLAAQQLYLIPDDSAGRAEIAAHLLCQAGFNTRIIKGASDHIYGSVE